MSTKRLLLTNEELQLLTSVVLHDWEADDDELAEKLRAKARGWRRAS